MTSLQAGQRALSLSANMIMASATCRKNTGILCLLLLGLLLPSVFVSGQGANTTTSMPSNSTQSPSTMTTGDGMNGTTMIFCPSFTCNYSDCYTMYTGQNTTFFAGVCWCQLIRQTDMCYTVGCVASCADSCVNASQTNCSVSCCNSTGCLNSTFASMMMTMTTTAMTQSSPAMTQSSSAMTQPSSTTTQSSSAMTQPSSVTTQPSSAMTQPSSATTQSSSAMTQPSSVTTQPSSATTQASSTTTQSSSATTQPSSATSPSGTSSSSSMTSNPGSMTTMMSTSLPSNPSAMTQSSPATAMTSNTGSTTSMMSTAATSNSTDSINGTTMVYPTPMSMIYCPSFTCNYSDCYTMYNSQNETACAAGVCWCQLIRQTDMCYTVGCVASCADSCVNASQTNCSVSCCNSTGCLNSTFASMMMTTTTVITTTTTTASTPATTTTSPQTTADNGNKCHKGTCTGTNCYTNFLNAPVQTCSSTEPHCQLKKETVDSGLQWTAGCTTNCSSQTPCKTSTKPPCHLECCNATMTSCLWLNGTLHVPNFATRGPHLHTELMASLLCLLAITLLL